MIWNVIILCLPIPLTVSFSWIDLESFALCDCKFLYASESAMICNCLFVAWTTFCTGSDLYTVFTPLPTASTPSRTTVTPFAPRFTHWGIGFPQSRWHKSSLKELPQQPILIGIWKNIGSICCEKLAQSLIFQIQKKYRWANIFFLSQELICGGNPGMEYSINNPQNLHKTRFCSSSKKR